MRFVTCVVLVVWLSAVAVASPAVLVSDGMLAMARTHNAFLPWLLTLPVWLASPLGRLAKLAGACLLTVLAASAARDLNTARSLLLPILLGLLGVTAIAPRREGSPISRREHDHDR